MDSKLIIDALSGNIEWYEPGRGLTKEEFQGLMRVSHPAQLRNWDCDEFTIPQEELSELNQAITKFKRYGFLPDVMMNLHEEVGDVLVSLSYIIQSCGLDEEIIKEIIRFKSENAIRRDGNKTKPHAKDKGINEWARLHAGLVESIRMNGKE